MAEKDPIDALYAVAPEDFVTQRDALAKKLRDAGDREAAAAVKKLAKPTRAAWAVNRLVRERPKEIRALVEAGEALAGAQEQLLAGADAEVLRGAAEAARHLVDALAADAEVDGATRDKVRATLHAATVDPDVRAEVASGRMVKERAASGFGGLDALAAAAPARGAKTKAKAKAKDRDKASAKAGGGTRPARERRPDPREVRRRRDDLRRANEAEATAERALVGARRALAQVESTLEARRADVEAAEQALSDARRRRERAEEAAAKV